MTVLVTAASRHGSTYEIAEAIGRALAERGVEADVRRPEDVEDVAAYDAVVLGAAVYMGKWVEDARRFVDEHAEALAARPTWLFSSGPIGDPPKPDAEEAVQVDDVVARAHARDHRVFAGKVDRSRLSLAERAVIRVVRASEGDYRDWAAIDAWAAGIAEALRHQPAPA
jgi:menaquinone-dependent protoporphyrinogen oxidase